MNIQVFLIEIPDYIRLRLQEFFQTYSGVELIGHHSMLMESQSCLSSMLPHVVMLGVIDTAHIAASVQTIRVHWSLTRILIISHTPSLTQMQVALNAGASGYCSLITAEAQIATLITLLAQGGCGWHYQASLSLTKNPRGLPNIQSPFTKRDLILLRYIIDGLSNKEIATALDISVKTVEARVTKLLRIADVQCRTALAVWWLQNMYEC